MWSVVILSPTLSPIIPLKESMRGSVKGGSPIFGPLKTSPLNEGLMTRESSTRKLSGISNFGKSEAGYVVGSVNFPSSAVTAAVSGETR